MKRAKERESKAEVNHLNSKEAINMPVTTPSPTWAATAARKVQCKMPCKQQSVRWGFQLKTRKREERSKKKWARESGLYRIFVNEKSHEDTDMAEQHVGKVFRRVGRHSKQA